MKKLLLSILAVATLTGCGEIIVTRTYVDVIPEEKAKPFAEWVDNCLVKRLDSGMIGSCYTLGTPMFSVKELHVKYKFVGGLGDYLYSTTTPCSTATLTQEEKDVCSGKVRMVRYDR